ncbi:hypothetical protein CIPA99_01667 [Corynebacterium diphtheriae]|nr:hypothetical protein CIP107517_01695 [Corynebacterium diphtheriae]CAB0658204.1 hypothetical protein CIPA99_01667 [Corynebacterium diphtheriae]
MCAGDVDKRCVVGEIGAGFAGIHVAEHNMSDRCGDAGSGNEEHTGDRNDPPAGIGSMVWGSCVVGGWAKSRVM